MPRTKTDSQWKPWHVRLYYEDGRSEVLVVMAESISSMVFALPCFSDVGKYRYEILKSGDGRSKIREKTGGTEK